MLTERFAAQLLSGPPAADAVGVVDQLLAVQAQDPRGFRLAVRARSTLTRVGEVDAALDAGDVVVGWLNRGTLHLVHRDDYWWMHALMTPQSARDCARRLRQTGVDEAAAERGVRAITRALADGPLTRSELRGHVAGAAVPTEGQAFVHLMFLAALRGLVVRGPMKDGEQAWVDARDWLGEPPNRIARDQALEQLVRRYLRGHGPATEGDLARWAKLPLRDVRRGVAAAATELQDRSDGLLALGHTDAQLPPPRLLGAFDPLLLGWVDRSAVLDQDSGQRLVTDNGIFRPFALVEGRAAGLWRYRDGRVSLETFAELPGEVVRRLEAEARAVEDFFAG